MPENFPALVPGETIETVRDRLECRRVAEAFIQRMVAIWADDRGVVSRHNRVDAGEETIEAIGQMMPISSTDAVVSRHGHLDAGQEIVLGYGPCIPFYPA